MRVHPEEESISAWLDGEAAPQDAEFLRLHMADCAECRDRLETLAEVRVTLSSLRNVAAPPALKRRLMADWEGRWGRLNSRRPVGSFVLPWLPAVACGLLVALAAPTLRSRWGHGPVGPPEPGSKIATHTLPSHETPRPVKTVESLPTKQTEPKPTGKVDAPPALLPSVKDKAAGDKETPERKIRLASSSDVSTGKARAALRQGPEHAGVRGEKAVRRSRRNHGTVERTPSASLGRTPIAPAVDQAPPPQPERPDMEAVRVAAGPLPVLEMIVEETPGEIRSSRPFQTSIVWAANDTANGTVSGGSMTRNYNALGQLQSVEVHMPVSDHLASAAPRPSAPPEERSESPVITDRPAPPDEKTEGNHDTPSPDHSSLVTPGLYAGVLRRNPDAAGI